MKQDEKRNIISNQQHQDKLHDQMEYQNRYLRKLLAMQYRAQADTKQKHKVIEKQIERSQEKEENYDNYKKMQQSTFDKIKRKKDVYKDLTQDWNIMSQK